MTTKKSNTGRIKRGRPTRASASTRALKDVDTSRCDIREQARRIALDASQPGSTRISALRLLAELDAIDAQATKSLQAMQEPETAPTDDQPQDDVLQDALRIMARSGGRVN